MCNNLIRRDFNISLLYYGNSAPKYAIDQSVYIINNLERFNHTIKTLSDFKPEVILGMSSGFRSIYFLKISRALNVPFCLHESTHFLRFCGENWARPRKISFFEAALEREIICAQAYCIRHVLDHSIKSFPSYILPQLTIFPNPINFKHNKRNAFRNKTIINVGGLKKVKNIFPLLDAFRKIHIKYPEWNVKIIGDGFSSEQNYKKTIFDYVEKNNLGDKVSFKGNIKNIEEEYSSSSIHVITSLDENFSMCTVEAMAFGIPTIGFTNSYGVSTLVDDGETGILVDVNNDISGLQEALEKLITDHEYWDYLSINAYNNVNNFSPDRIYDLWENVFLRSKHYHTDDGLLLNEQMAVDRDRALFSRKKAYDIIESYSE